MSTLPLDKAMMVVKSSVESTATERRRKAKPASSIQSYEAHSLTSMRSIPLKLRHLKLATNNGIATPTVFAIQHLASQ